eukprot:TRINITY_DN50063_c0_g1_i1.p1 TRINITY_DN50063_c0_g1~~TRINITY_DN50063_c0_g1_i1.p1  ORF type:complete len:1178 (+),score=107.62 TRINITY_DN50063_c0_g1_i1:100-3633(+)
MCIRDRLGTLTKTRGADRPLLVYGHKANLGHTASASGLLALIVMGLSLAHQTAPPVLNVEKICRPLIVIAATGALISTDAPSPLCPGAIASMSGTSLSGDNVHSGAKASGSARNCNARVRMVTLRGAASNCQGSPVSEVEHCTQAPKANPQCWEGSRAIMESYLDPEHRLANHVPLRRQVGALSLCVRALLCHFKTSGLQCRATQTLTPSELSDMTPSGVREWIVGHDALLPPNDAPLTSPDGDDDAPAQALGPGDQQTTVALVVVDSVSDSARALASIRAQTRQPAHTVIVGDTSEPGSKPGTIPPAAGATRVCVELGAAKTVCANIGIRAIFKRFGPDCWVAVLDATDEWTPDHLELCSRAAGCLGSPCEWVLSGIERRIPGQNAREENLYPMSPVLADFCLQHSRVSSSSVYVRCGTLLAAGLFDEAMPTLYVPDLCIRLVDVLPSQPIASCVTSTMSHTILCHTDPCGCDSDVVEGTGLFFYKHEARMSVATRQAFMEHAHQTFEWDPDRFLGTKEGPLTLLLMWNGDSIAVRSDTAKALCDRSDRVVPPALNLLVGVITNSTSRFAGLLGDLQHMFAASTPNNNFVVIFVNSEDTALADEIQEALRDRRVPGYVLRTCHPTVPNSIGQPMFPLSIAKARTVLQTYLRVVTKRRRFDAVAVLDDDLRLPKGWSPLALCRDSSASAHAHGDMFLGRVAKTPPNPTMMSMRTQLVDLVHGLDTYMCGEGGRVAIGKGYKPKIFEDLNDQYYDLSATRSDHLEMPRSFVVSHVDINQYRHKILVGDPLAREAVSTEEGPSTQRGGCMVLFPGSFDALETEQVSPQVPLDLFGRVAHTRRSDSFFCQHHQKAGKSIQVVRELSIVHENWHDKVPSPAKIREVVALEMCGAILCRPPGPDRARITGERLLRLKCSVRRIRGICCSIRGRAYFDQIPGLSSFASELEALFDEEAWQAEVYTVVEEQSKRLRAWEPKPRRLDLRKLQRGWFEYEWILDPVPCIHRVHACTPHGAHSIQAGIGMSLEFGELVRRLRCLSRMVSSLNQHHGTRRKALVTFDDGFNDVMLLREAFVQLENLQPVLFVPSGQLIGEGRHLPLTCLYAHCANLKIDPNSQELGDIQRMALKAVPETTQYERLRRAGVDVTLPVDDLLSIAELRDCLLYTSPSPRDRTRSRMPSSA